MTWTTEQTRKNYAGGESFSLSPELELYSRVCTASLYPKYYESPKETIERIRELVATCDPEFVAKLAVYSREQMNLRTIPLVLTVELAKVHNGTNLVSRLAERIIQRVDEIPEILSYYQFVNRRIGVKKLNKLSKQLEKGVGSAFGKFDEYQFAKYDRDGDVKLRDALFLTHPKPQDQEQAELFQKIVEGTLETPYTWETKLSEAGQNGTSKKEIWEELIDSRKVGYMALLRNLRNILNAGVSDAHIDKVCEYLSNENAVTNSRQLPFRFLSAYRMLNGGIDSRYSMWGRVDVPQRVTSDQLPKVLAALEKAVKISAKNIPVFDNEDVLIATDVSGSMCQPVSPKSVVQQYDIGSILAMMANDKAVSARTGIFGDKFEIFQFPKDNILKNADKLRSINGKVGYSTHGHKVLKYANDNRLHLDRVMIFTDCQLYGGSLKREWDIFKENNPQAKLYLFDLGGYGQTPISVMENDVYLIAGWSDKVFNVINAIEDGEEALSVINDIEL